MLSDHALSNWGQLTSCWAWLLSGSSSRTLWKQRLAAIALPRERWHLPSRRWPCVSKIYSLQPKVLISCNPHPWYIFITTPNKLVWIVKHVLMLKSCLKTEFRSRFCSKVSFRGKCIAMKDNKRRKFCPYNIMKLLVCLFFTLTFMKLLSSRTACWESSKASLYRHNIISVAARFP